MVDLARFNSVALGAVLGLALVARAPAAPVAASTPHASHIIVARRFTAQLRALRRYAIPTPNSGPFSIAPGPNGDLSFTESGAWKIAEITVTGAIREFRLPAPPYQYHQLGGVVTGPDKRVYVTADQSGCGGRGCFNAGNVYKAVLGSVLPALTLGGGFFPDGITNGPNGNLWFADESNTSFGGATGGAIWEMTATGSMTEFSTLGQNFNIVSGADGNLWFSELDFPNFTFVPGIGTMTPSGTVTLLPTPSGLYTSAICAGPDGNVWFTESSNSSSAIGRITPNRAITEFPTPTFSGSMGGITTGRDGDLWFTEGNAGNIGRITRQGVITEFAVGGEPYAIASGPDGDIWFTDIAGNTINKFRP